MPDLRCVLANGAVARELAHACYVQHRSARPALLIAEVALRVFVRLDVRAEIGEMEVAVAINHRLVYPPEEAELSGRETIGRQRVDHAANAWIGVVDLACLKTSGLALSDLLGRQSK